MSVDPDILAIRRKRRQEGKCAACGARSGRLALCDTHRATLAYCPDCADIYQRRASFPSTCATQRCPKCSTAVSRRKRGGRTRAQYLATTQARLIPEIMARYRKGEPLDKTARAVGLTRIQIDHLISYARKSGKWPKGLRRVGRDGHGKPGRNTRDEQ